MEQRERAMRNQINELKLELARAPEAAGAEETRQVVEHVMKMPLRLNDRAVLRGRAQRQRRQLPRADRTRRRARAPTAGWKTTPTGSKPAWRRPTW
jgi:hypothetical protein